MDRTFWRNPHAKDIPLGLEVSRASHGSLRMNNVLQQTLDEAISTNDKLCNAKRVTSTRPCDSGMRCRIGSCHMCAGRLLSRWENRE